MNRSLKLLIASSLLLNLLLAGVLIGHTCRYFIGEQGSGLKQFVSSLPQEKRRALETIIEQAYTDNALLEKQIMQTRYAVANTIETNPFDSQAFTSHIKHMHELKIQLADRRSATLSKVAAQCSPAERATLAGIVRRHKPLLWPESNENESVPPTKP